MALSVDVIYKFALRLIKKNQAGGLSSLEFNDFWNDAQGSYQDDLLGRFQMRSNGKTGANTGLILDETILQKLAPFTKKATLTITAGNANKPTGFIYRLAMRIGNYDVHKINHSQLANAATNVIDPPDTAENSVYFVEYEGYFTFLPTSATTATLDYIETPPNVVWGYTLDGDGREVYDAGTSVQPLWDNNSCREITKRMLTDIGVSFKDKDFENFGKSVQITGE